MLARYDFHFASGHCSSRSGRAGSATCDVSYHVGVYGFSLWLVGLTVVVCAAAIAVRLLGRSRADRAYWA